jgi:hypothetical protein
MVSRQACIFLAVTVAACIWLTPAMVRADTILPIALADPPGVFDKLVDNPGTGVNAKTANGLPATFDPIRNVLSLDNPIPDGTTLIWKSTDENLEFAVEFDAVASETSSLELLGIGFVVMVLILRFRPTKK